MRSRRFWRDDEGATAIMVALCMVAIMGVAALAIDVGAYQAKKSQVQNAADAAATAIATQCYESPLTTTTGGCASAVRTAANATAASLSGQNINDGSAAGASSTFTISTVTVTVMDPQATFFAEAFGISSSTATATATAEWGKGAIAWPIAYPECALPSAPTNRVLLRYDTLVVLNSGISCGLISTSLGLGWTTGLLGLGPCVTDVNLLSYVNSIASGLLTLGSNPCSSKFSTLVGKKVLLPIYNSAIGDVVIDGVLLSKFSAAKFAVLEVTGYDFTGLLSLTFDGATYKVNDPASPVCGPGLSVLTCQGLQGNYLGTVTPAQAKEMASGVTLID